MRLALDLGVANPLLSRCYSAGEQDVPESDAEILLRIGASRRVSAGVAASSGGGSEDAGGGGLEVESDPMDGGEAAEGEVSPEPIGRRRRAS